MKEKQHLNLARKWRSKTFDTIVGQPLSVRMLKNSLYLGQFFPVYLFSGQRGCGKTSTARVFAAAINCEQLPEFQKNPKESSVPCLECSSCVAMRQVNHPDFIEIDAASHTGVDNVRNIIDSSSLLPLSGRKKIYLIDEVHMLSKAAFNAFLKILEDPPESVVFMLATTDPQKIIETVISRSFQLFFAPIAHDDLHKHLRMICDEESIKADDDALALIVRESEGSARDAINLLEQVRFSTDPVTVKAVLAALGHVSDDVMVNIIETVMVKTPADILKVLQDSRIETYSAEKIYQKLISFIRAALWSKYDLEPPADSCDMNVIKSFAARGAASRFSRMLVVLTDYEQSFLRTTKKHILLEIMLLQLCNKQDDVSQVSSSTPQKKNPEPVSPIKEKSANDVIDPQWSSYLLALNEKQDPLVSSIFVQATFIGYDREKQIVKLQFAKQASFFEDLLSQGESVWKPVLQAVFGEEIKLETSFDADRPLDSNIAKKSVGGPIQGASEPRTNRPAQTVIRKKEIPLDVSDKDAWQKTNTLLEHFPGRVTEIVGGSDEEKK